MAERERLPGGRRPRAAETLGSQGRAQEAAHLRLVLDDHHQRSAPLMRRAPRASAGIRISTSAGTDGGGLATWQRQPKDRAAAGAVLGDERAAVRVRDAEADGQAETRARRIRPAAHDRTFRRRASRYPAAAPGRGRRPR